MPASNSDTTFKISRPSKASTTATAASPARTSPTFGSALPLERKVTPLDQETAMSNMDSISTVAAAAAAIPLATEPGYQDPQHYFAAQDQSKQVRFDEASKRHVKSHFTATAHCGVSKRGRYVSPGRRAFSMPDISQSASTLLSAAAVAASKENEGNSSQVTAQDTSHSSTKELLMSPKQSADSKSFVATTPTDFPVDFRSTPTKSGAFDTSNVLAWLSSPGFFSPGFSSPDAKSNGSKPPTPIVSTSFFFSDVANLPKGGGDNNIICISPLAASKMTHGESWKEVFTSPSTRIPVKSDEPRKPSPKGMDAVLAEKDIREDEDLSVLLKLASHSTPRSTSVPPILPTMQESGKVRLSQKMEQRADSFKPPSLEMRPNSKRGVDQAFPFQTSSDYYGSMRVSIGGSKGPPSPRQQEPYPYQMYAAYYQQPNAPYNYPPGFKKHPPVSESAPAIKSRPRKKAKNADKGDDGSLSSTGKPHALSSTPASTTKSSRKRTPNKRKNKSPQIGGERERVKAAEKIQSLNGGRNDKAAALAAAILRGVTQRPSGKWQAQLYFAGKSRYIGVFDSREKAALAYEIAREKLRVGAATAESTEDLVNEARKAAFDGVNEQLPSK